MPDAGRTDRRSARSCARSRPTTRLTDPIESPNRAEPLRRDGRGRSRSRFGSRTRLPDAAHSSCPRYLRGATVETEAPVAHDLTPRELTPATIGALALLAAAFSASVMFTLRARWPGPAGRRSRDVRRLRPRARWPGPEPTPSADPSAEPPPSRRARRACAPSARRRRPPSPSPTRLRRRRRPRRPAPTSERYALLEPCPDTPDCWIYRVRAGDNLFSIAKYFGVPLATVKA